MTESMQTHTESVTKPTAADSSTTRIHTPRQEIEILRRHILSCTDIPIESRSIRVCLDALSTESKRIDRDEECTLNAAGKRPLPLQINASKKWKKTLPKPKDSPSSSADKTGFKVSPEASVTSSPEDRPKCTPIISASTNFASGNKNDTAAALEAAMMRGVTMRPSGKWQAQLYYAGKSRYIGVFDKREKAALAYEIVREKLKTGKPFEPASISSTDTDAKMNAAKKAAYDGVNHSEVKSVTEK